MKLKILVVAVSILALAGLYFITSQGVQSNETDRVSEMVEESAFLFRLRAQERISKLTGETGGVLDQNV